MSSFFAVAAASWGVLMSLSPILQIRAMRRAGSSSGVSLGYLAVLFVGFALWFSYGLSIGNSALIITNTMSLIVGSITLATALRLRPREVQADEIVVPDPMLAGVTAS